MPLTVMTKSLEVLKLTRPVAEKGNVNSISDAGVAGLMAMAAVDGAFYNVKINLGGISDDKFVKKTREEAERIAAEAKKLADEIRSIVESKL